jgi:hypothetical protein
MGVFAGNRAEFLSSSPTMTVGGLNWNGFGSAINWTVDGFSGDARGPWFISRLDAVPQLSGNYLELFYHGPGVGAADTFAATGLPTGSNYLLGNNNGVPQQFSAVTLSAAGIGAGFTIDQYQTFLNDINTVENILRLKTP